jgi:hypothetical protein
MIIAVWLIALLALSLWSLGAWGLHSLLVALPNDWSGLAAWVDKLLPAPWLEHFLPGWQALLTGLLKFVEVALSWAGGAADVMSWFVLVVWALGALFLLSCAVIGSLLVAWVRKSTTGQPLLTRIH